MESNEVLVLDNFYSRVAKTTGTNHSGYTHYHNITSLILKLSFDYDYE